MPKISRGDNLLSILVDCFFDVIAEERLNIEDKDIIAITESLLARAQGNFVSLTDVATDIHKKFNGEKVGVLFPIMSRNRFANVLRAISMGAKEVVVQLSYPRDEVGNSLISDEKYYEIFYGKDIIPSFLSDKQFADIFEIENHKFTGVNYIELYKSLGDNISVILGNNPKDILEHTRNVLISTIRNRELYRKLLQDAPGRVLDLTQILNTPTTKHGYNDKWGLLGSNKSGEGDLKLFPVHSEEFCYEVQKRIYELTKKTVEVMVFGDGAFKCPSGQIWELADPVVSPGYTAGLNGRPSELKYKNVADSNGFDTQQMIETIRNKNVGIGDLGTTPREIPDLVGSLSDLMMGSGDKGTPAVLIKRYFKNYGDD